MSKGWLKNALNISHFYMKHVLRPGDTAIDATCGRGKDTAFLAEMVGEEGTVWAFDIQPEAIESTRSYLNQRGLNNQVKLIRDSHENIRQYVAGPVRACMFNLGYLPGADHTIKTTTQSTLQALGEVLDILETGGAVTIVSYPGHEGGLKELEVLYSYLSGLSQHDFEIAEISFLNQINHPPRAIIIEKLERR